MAAIRRDRLLAAGGQPLQPGVHVPQVVGLLAAHLGHHLGQRGVGGGDQGVEAGRVGGVVQEPAGHRERPVGAGMVEQPGMPVLLRPPPEGDRVRVAPSRSASSR